MDKSFYDAIIFGSGLNGSLMALSLAKVGFHIAIFDTNASKCETKLQFDGRAYSIISSSKFMLEYLDIWDDLKNKVQSIEDIKVSTGQPVNGPSPFFIHFNSDATSESMGYIVEDRHLRVSVQSKLSKFNNIKKIFGKEIRQINNLFNFRQIILNDGQSIMGQVIIGADGRNSVIGKNADINRICYDYKQTGIVCAVQHQYEHMGEAHQFFMPGGPIAILPMLKKRSSIVWTEKTDVAKPILQLDDIDFLSELKRRFGNFRGEISLVGKRFSFPLSLNIAERLIDSRVALIGEAANSIHPIAGQGLNLGLRDIASLTEVILEARERGEDFGTTQVLQRYSVWRSLDRLSLSVVTDKVNKIFSNDDLIFKIIRNLGIGALNNLPLFKKLIVREASGLTGDLPKMMKKNDF